ncbi:hypothetical protein FRC02_000552 [Tulasnella sp. 418]|nr:hypothetical protein FRC02_000552 [Tulasnella sp. 418]
MTTAKTPWQSACSWFKLAIFIWIQILGGVYAAGGEPPGGNPATKAHPDRFDRDPYLDYQPKFAYSLPVQILLTGMVIALVFVLFVQLLFTVQYHWPLARLNYALQLSGVCTLLISLISTLIVILQTTYHKSREWPYMLDYIAVSIPRQNSWSQAQRVCWYIMSATTSALVNITHIQFLTLLYPSPVEARLIFSLLGPLAIASSGMEFAAMLSSDKARDLGQAIRDVCNSTLTLLFTLALFIWGFGLNRKQAWRTDGGTAVFGAGALSLAVISTVINFVQISEEELEWLPGLLWAVVLWQSFLGWWWWVGSGMGIGEVEDMLLKEQKRKEAKIRRRAKKNARRVRVGPNGELLDDERDPPLTRFTRGVINASTQPARNLIRRRDTPNTEALTQSATVGSALSSGTLHGNHAHPNAYSGDGEDQQSSSATVTSSSDVLGSLGRLYPFTLISRSWRRLRHAHVTATQVQAIEQVEIRAQVYGTNGAELGGAGGWGLGNFGLREREEAERRIREFNERRRQSELLPEIEGRSSDADDTSGHSSDEAGPRETPTSRRNPANHDSTVTPSERRIEEKPERNQPEPTWTQEKSRTFWWWGPLRRWRLQDVTQY